MRQYELVEKVLAYKPDADEALLNKAYVYAMQKHGTQKRANGDPYFSHPLEVANILTDMKLDDATIAVALLHDTIEDTSATRQEIDEMFGESIGDLVEGLTKIKRIDLVSKKAEQAENLRRLLLAISQDVRVLLVKLADRLHNMRTLNFVPVNKRARIAAETMDIYAPLAGRMGMQDLRDELQNLAFSHLNPEAYQTVTKRLEELALKNTDLISEIEKTVTEKLAANGISAIVSHRRKKPHSVFRKMERKGISLEQLSDIFGFRILLDTVDQCYAALGIIHTTWPMVPGRFKDYISIPKQNDYRSIHTTIVGPSRQRVELQIRTKGMHYIADYGIAAHTAYKEANGENAAENGSGKPNGASTKGAKLERMSSGSNAYAWLRQTIDLLSDGNNPEDFLEHTKLELFLDQVFCFTPKGRLIALPRGATPIDFAYAVHTEIGDNCVGARINGRTMPVITELQNGDEVEIIRGNKMVPPPAWESIVVTGKARAAIRRASRDAIIEQYSGLGKRILERAFERAGKKYSTDHIEGALKALSRKNVDDVLASVGRGDLSSLDIIRAAFPDYKDDRVKATPKTSSSEGWFGLKRGTGLKFKVPGWRRSKSGGSKNKSDDRTGPLPIRGINSDLPVRLAPEGAVPGDRIVGILEPKQGITIYPIQSSALQAFEDKPEKWLDVRWEIEEGSTERFLAKISIMAINEPGTLEIIASAIANHDGNIHKLSMVSTAHDFTEMLVELEVWDLKHLTRIISQLKSKEVVSVVERLHD